ncbi:MAG: hypothetical protein E7262_03110 [Lachnospiraceae bacterium]|nr:hypothetical protein [Lachnospiraceae bacterium]
MENGILVDAGDATQGKSLATCTQGNALIELMNSAGYSLSIFGNHEFDYGMDQLLKNIENAKFTFLAANVRKDNGDLLLKTEEENGGYKIIEVEGKKIGFFGISTTETAYKTNPNNVKGIKFEPEIESTQKVADELNGLGCDYVVGLMHVGIDKESNPKSTDIADAVTGVDVIIDGHSHSDLQYESKNGTKVVQAGTQIKKLGQITVTFAQDETKVETKLVTDEEFKKYGKKEEVESLYQKFTKELDEIYAEVVGNTATDIIANEVTDTGKVKRLVRNRETAIGDLVTDSMLWEAEKFLSKSEFKDLPLVAMTNGGGLRDDLKAGDITVGEVFAVTPYSMTLVVKEVTPNVLYEALESSISCLTLNENNEVSGYSGGFPQVSGMRYEMDLTKKAYEEGVCKGEKVVAVYYTNKDGKEQLLDRNDTTTKIALAANNFIYAGGDGYSMLSGMKPIVEGNVMDEILADYITKLTEESENGSFTYVMDGNRSVEINSKKNK